MTYARWNQLQPIWREALIRPFHERALADREALISDYATRWGDRAKAEAYAETVWWARKEYCTTYVPYTDDSLFSVCEDCGRPMELMTCLYDKPCDDDCDRDCGFKCPCGKVHHHVYC